MPTKKKATSTAKSPKMKKAGMETRKRKKQTMAQLLMTIPGIGPLTEMYIKAEKEVLPAPDS